MDKSCKRCSNEPAVVGLPVGQMCLDNLRSEVRDYEEILSEPELGRLERRRSQLREDVDPRLSEIEELDHKIAEQLETEKAALDLDISSLEDEGRTEAEIAELRRLEEQIDAEQDPNLRIG